MSGKKKLLKFLGLGTVSVILLGLIVYIVVVRPLQIRQEKKNFAAAEVKLDDLAKQIEQTIGKPDEVKKEKSCGYASRPFGKGPRGCGVSVNILYRSKDFAQSNESMKNISSLLGTKLYYYLGEQDGEGRPYPRQFIRYVGRGPSQQFSQDISETFGTVNCTISYLYPIVPLFEKEFSSLAKENFQLNLSCGGPASREFFPVKK